MKMPVEFCWHDEQETIAIYTFSGSWFWDEFERVDRPLWEMFHKNPRRIDIVADFTRINNFPLGLPPTMHRVGSRTESVKRGLVILVDAPRIAKILFAIFRRTYPGAASVYRIVPTLDQALAIIEEARQHTKHENGSSVFE